VTPEGKGRNHAAPGLHFFPFLFYPENKTAAVAAVFFGA
jgi:hypothetical protein